MSKPIVAVVGRPNVGKSTLFNKLIGERRSIVEDTPGVTRDRIYGETEWNGRRMVLIDTGGIEPKTNDVILAQMKVQAQIAIDTADVIVFLCDVRTGVTANDRDIAVMLKKSGKPIVPAINKCDSVGRPPMEFYEFYELGFDRELIQVSSIHGSGSGDILDACLEELGDFEEAPEETAVDTQEASGEGDALIKELEEIRDMFQEAIDSAANNEEENEQGELIQS
ncbi:MAG: 50S ribosome-binding GTPase, partial [Clostridia bacterium]|nr:50S ribosome-binding GTPase [Clostridia bacterium]